MQLSLQLSKFTFCLLGDGSCFIVQQDLDYVIELTGADYDAVYKVQARWRRGLGDSPLGPRALEGTESSYFVILRAITYLGVG